MGGGNGFNLSSFLGGTLNSGVYTDVFHKSDGFPFDADGILILFKSQPDRYFEVALLVSCNNNDSEFTAYINKFRSTNWGSWKSII